MKNRLRFGLMMLGALGGTYLSAETPAPINESLEVKKQAIARFLKGTDLFASGHSADAISEMNQAILLDPYFEKAHNYLGIIHSRLGQKELALKSYTRALEIEPMYADAAQNVGRIHLEQGRFGEAIIFLKRAAFLQNENPMTHYLLGACYYLKGDYASAIPAYLRGIELDPELMDGQAFYSLGVCYQETGRFKEALWQYAEVLQRFPQHPQSLNNAALCYHAVGLSQKGIRLLQTVLKYHPENPKALLNLGNILFDQKEYAAAEDYFRRAIQCGEVAFKAKNNLGLVYAETGKSHEARELWEEILSEDPGNIQSLNNLANFHLKEKDFGSAIANYKKLVELEPGNGHFLNALGYTLVDQNQELPLGLQCIEKALSLDPANHAIYLDSLGWYYYRVGEYGRAKETIAHAISILKASNEGNSSEIHYHLAMVQRAMEDKLGEIASLKNALLAEPESDFALMAKKDLEGSIHFPEAGSTLVRNQESSDSRKD